MMYLKICPYCNQKIGCGCYFIESCPLCGKNFYASCPHCGEMEALKFIEADICKQVAEEAKKEFLKENRRISVFTLFFITNIVPISTLLLSRIYLPPDTSLDTWARIIIFSLITMCIGFYLASLHQRSLAKLFEDTHTEIEELLEEE